MNESEKKGTYWLKNQVISRSFKGCCLENVMKRLLSSSGDRFSARLHSLACRFSFVLLLLAEPLASPWDSAVLAPEEEEEPSMMSREKLSWN